MKTFLIQRSSHRRAKGFTLVEMLVVIAIMSILVTAGAVGLSGIGGKGVTTGVSTSEALFDEARSTAVGRNLRSCVLVAETLTNNPAEDLRRIIIAYEETEKSVSSPNFGQAKNPGPNPNWELSSRGALLPEKTFFSSKFSKKDQQGGTLETIPSSKIVGVKPPFAGRYFIYRFNNQGILTDSGPGTYEGGASFIIGSGARNSARSAIPDNLPRTVSEAKMDFGGFVIWRNGRTSVYRSPDQMKIPNSVKEF